MYGIDVEHAGDFTPTKSHGLGKVVTKGEHSQSHEDVQILFGRQAQFVAVGKNLGAFDFNLADTLANSPLQHGEGNGREVFFLDGQVDQRRFEVVFIHVQISRTKVPPSVFVTLLRQFVLAIYDEPHGCRLFLLAGTCQPPQIHFISTIMASGVGALPGLPNHKPFHITLWIQEEIYLQVVVFTGFCC